MNRPPASDNVIFVVDHRAGSPEAVGAELTRRFGSDFDVTSASSDGEAFATLETMAPRSADSARSSGL